METWSVFIPIDTFLWQYVSRSRFKYPQFSSVSSCVRLYFSTCWPLSDFSGQLEKQFVYNHTSSSLSVTKVKCGCKKREFLINTIECAVVRLMMTLNSLENRAIPLIEFFSRRKQAMSRSRVLKPGRFKFYQVVLITLQSMDAIEY